MIYDVERSLFGGGGDKRFLRRMFFALSSFYSWYCSLADHRLIGQVSEVKVMVIIHTIFRLQYPDTPTAPLILSLEYLILPSYLTCQSFLGLDNAQVLNRSKMEEYPAFEAIYQVDGTAWCAQMALSLMKIALELDMGEAAASFFCNVVYRGHAMNNFADGLERPGYARPALWSDDMGWYCDVIKYEGKDELQSLKCRTLIGMVPLFAAQCFKSLEEIGTKHPLFSDHVAEFTLPKLNKQHTQKVISVPVDDLPVPMQQDQTVVVGGDGSRRLGMFLADQEKLRVMLETILDEDHFLSAYGIRSASKELEREPYNFDCGDGHGWKQYKYLPRESYGDGKLFGGNSSWRGGMLASVLALIAVALSAQAWHFSLPRSIL